MKGFSTKNSEGSPSRHAFSESVEPSGASLKQRLGTRQVSKRTFQLAIGISILFLIGVTSNVLACSCLDPGPPCQAYWNSSVVFVGTALSVSRIEVDWDGHKVPQRLFRFRIEDAFRGVSGSEVEVLTGAGGGDCGYDFQRGTKYLIYGNKGRDKSWVGTSICTRTRPLSEAAEDLSFIRSISKLPAGAAIYGTAKQYNVNLETGAWDLAGPVAGAVVIASSGDRRLEQVTRDEGSYRFSNLGPGKYLVRVTLPTKLSPADDQNVEIHDRGCAEINYRVVIDGRIEGRLLDAGGQSAGIKTVDLLPLTNDGKTFRPLWAITETDGSFKFKKLPPGRYLLAINLNDAPGEDLPYKKTFYPFSQDQSKAEIFSLGEGQQLTGIDFRLPPPLTARTIGGTVVWPDGRPAVGAEVTLKDVESGRDAKWGIKTDANGHFMVSGFEGVRYKIAATIPADPNWKPDSGKSVELLSTAEVEIMLPASVEPVRLVIDPGGDGTKRTRSVVRAPPPKAKPKRRAKPQ